MANVVVSALATWNGKALKKGQKEISVFDKQVQKLGRTFGAVFSATALLSYSKRAINAFAADEKAAKSLEVQLKNTGNEFSAPAVEMYIANLQKISGILDDELRPAFQGLLTVTRSLVLSQYALNTALDVSAGTGASVGEVANAIAKGFGGQTRALKTLVPGLDEAALKSGDMNKILEELNKKFTGQSAARLTTYAGKMDLLKVASANATEIIGKGLVDALTTLSKDQSIENLSNSMENLANNTAAAIGEMAKLISKFTELTGNPSFKAGMLAAALLTKNPTIITSVMGYIGITGALGVATKNFGLGAPNVGTPFGQAGSSAELARINEAKRIAAANGLRKTENAQIKAKTELEKLKDKYDVERINLMQALNLATDEETKLRIAEKLAILDGNAAKAQEYLAADNAYDWRLQEIESLKELTAAQYKAASSMTTLADWVAYRAGERGDKISTNAAAAAGMSFPSSAPVAMGAVQRGEYTDVTVNVNAGTIVAEQELQGLITDTVRVALKSGNKLLPAGSIA